MLPTPAQVKQFQHKIFSYFRKNGRDLPWRSTNDPYSILVSEIMLQQTQVDRVIPFYTSWMKKWPTIHDLAAASRSDVLRAWLGLGYNSRAIRLHELAKKVSSNYDGNLMLALQKEKLPGIGPYTQRAIQIFANNDDNITIDTNIRRILMHKFHLSTEITDKDIELLAQQCLPRGRSREWHNALMDYGATLLTARKTGIKPKTTQSKFEGSDRQMRAKIVRYLIMQQPSATKYELSIFLRIPRERSEQIIEKMVKEGFLTKDKKNYSISQGSIRIESSKR